MCFLTLYCIYSLALPRTETNNKISSSTSSINEIKSDQGHQIRVDFRAASSQFRI